jgi:hypothetical protein
MKAGVFQWHNLRYNLREKQFFSKVEIEAIIFPDTYDDNARLNRKYFFLIEGGAGRSDSAV